MTLLKSFIEFMGTSSGRVSFWLIIVSIAAVQAVPKFLLPGVRGPNSEQYMTAYVLFTVTFPLFEYAYNCYMTTFQKEFRGLFTLDGYQKYDKLSFDNKKKTDVLEFRRKMCEAENSMVDIMRWGIPTSMNLISSIISIFYIFFVEELLAVLFALLIVNVLVYFFVTRHMQDKYAEKRQLSRKVRLENMAQIENKLPQLEAGNKAPEQLYTHQDAIISSQNANTHVWLKISLITNIVNKLGLLIFLFEKPEDAAYFFLIIQTLGSFSGSLQSAMFFKNQYEMLSLKFETYEDMWKGVTFEDDVEKLDIPDKVKITSIDVTRGDFILTGDPLTFCKGGRILIQGQSGGGKSTFIQALLGLISGVTLEYGEPKNFYHQVVEFQDQDNMPTGEISIRSLFDDELDNDLIQKCLTLACAYTWAKGLVVGKTQKKARKSISLSDFVKMAKEYVFGEEPESESESEPEPTPKVEEDPHIFDRKIKKAHSRGQKERLRLSLAIYRLIKSGAKWLILDEPEQGSDPEVGYQIITNIHKKFPDVTIFVISHLERIREVLDWDMYLKVSNGQVTHTIPTSE